MASNGKRFLGVIRRHATPEELPLILLACSGLQVQVPRETLTSRNWLARIVGLERATVLTRCLNEADLWGPIDVPFDGHGLMATVRNSIRTRIEAGILAGRRASEIAVECGMTVRGVRLHRARMRRLGQLPEADEPVALAAAYLRTKPDKGVAPAISVHVAPPHHNDVGDNLLHAAIEAAVPWQLDDPDGAERVATAGLDIKIEALIAYVHGKTVAARILAACAGRKVSFSARAMERADHPFRVALDAIESRLLAIKVVASGFGDRLVSFGKPGASEIAPHVREGGMISGQRAVDV